MLVVDFSQRKLLNSRLFKLERDGIAVTEKSPFASHRFHVPFENIPPKAQEITFSPRKWLTASLLFTVLTLIVTPALLLSEKWTLANLSAIPFWGALATVSWIIFFLKRTSLLIYSQNGGTFVLHANDPSPEEVSRFLRRMFESRNKYLRTRYAHFSLEEPLADRLNRLEFLFRQEVLTDAEYQLLRKEQTGGSASRSGRIGFAN